MAPGLQVIYDSGQDASPPCTAQIDVVAVHGLNIKNNPEHARETWMKDEGLWLRDLLPQCLARPVRVMLFEYQSSPAMGATALKIDDHAKTLLQWLNLKRRGNQTPIVFICHSLGGLVVKEALVEGTLDSSYKSIVEATRLLAFFATPHRGGKYASVGDVAAAVVKASLRKPSNDLLNALKQSCEETTRRFDQSRHLFEKCLVISFFEGLPYRNLGIIVDKMSATLNLPGTREKQVAMHSDHSSICKLDSADPASELVLGTIATEVERALELQPTSAYWPRTHSIKASSSITTAPRTVLNTIGAMSEIIDLLNKNVCAIKELPTRWQNVDLTILTFETQLTALKTAWVKLKEWNESNVDNAHYQLTMDLDVCIACCRLLVGRIDTVVSQFQMKAGSLHDAAGEFQVLLKTEVIGNIQRLMEQQTNTLSLLLATCDRTPSKQKGLLEEPHAREVFRRMEDETTSLLVLRDVDSMIPETENTVNTSKRSLKFDFDKDLFVTRAYERWIRGSVRKVLREQQCDMAELRIHREAQAKQSQAIERGLKKDSRKMKREFKILLFGSQSRLDIHKLADSRNGDGVDYKPIVIRNLMDGAQALVRQAKDFDQVPDDLQDEIKLIDAYDLHARHPSPSAVLDQSFYNALTSILRSPWIGELKERNFRPNLAQGAEYFFREITRIAAKDYVPSTLDILETTTAAPGIYEKTISYYQLRFRLIDLGRQQPDIHKWFHYFDSGTRLVFVVDLDTYDQYLGEPPQSELLRSLIWFKTVVNYGWRPRTGVILFLNKAARFKEKLKHLPLEDYFANPGVENDKFSVEVLGVLHRFEQACPSNVDLYKYVQNGSESSMLNITCEIMFDHIMLESHRELILVSS